MRMKIKLKLRGSKMLIIHQELIALEASKSFRPKIPANRNNWPLVTLVLDENIQDK
jgi:hypothetical protein